MERNNNSGEDDGETTVVIESPTVGGNQLKKLQSRVMSKGKTLF
jgi:hypothetical protein